MFNTEKIKSQLAEIFASEAEYDFANEQIITFYHRSDPKSVEEATYIRELEKKVYQYSNLMWVDMLTGGSHRKNKRNDEDMKRLGIRNGYLSPTQPYPTNQYIVHYEDVEKARAIGMRVKREKKRD